MHISNVIAKKGPSLKPNSNFLGLSDSAAKSGNYALSLSYLDSALKKNRVPSPKRSRLLLKKALVLQVQSRFSDALLLLFEARHSFEKDEDLAGLGEVATTIGAIYHNLGDFPKADEYYQLSLKIYQDQGKWKELARCYNNFGSLAEDMNQPKKALQFHQKSMAIWKEKGEIGWEGISFMHLGVCHELLGNSDSAMFYLDASAKSLEKAGNQRTLALVYSLLGNTSRKMGQAKKAREWCEKGLQISQELRHPRYESKCSECLFKVFDDLGMHEKALIYFKRFILLRDSVFNEQKAKEITRMEMDYGFQQRRLADSLNQARIKHQVDLNFEKKLAREKEKRNFFVFSGILILLFAGGLGYRLQLVRKSRRLLSEEKDRSEKLLLKVLPAEIVEELKLDGKTEGREHENISVLFLDVKNFTAVAQQMSPKALVEEIHLCFEQFDAIVETHGLEKIKTIGDSYMAAAGVPVPIKNGELETIFTALEIQQFLKNRKSKRDAQGLSSFEMRAGIHTGHVIAGVVGVNKFQYDIWGDTVNTASRMETTGEAGKVNISRETYEAVKSHPNLSFEFRGVIDVKGKGLLEMYFVDWEN
jgi:class 3 adenylate cyclase